MINENKSYRKKSMYQIYNKETWYGLGKIFLKIRNIKKIKLKKIN